ncbi:ComF family protein [Geobacter sp. FeAm09]|uniref:ComF family protein n=1 Tax=Geobacter sp. FeAm09 TaxID=2597769 RepID=UPI0011F034B3|nr:ComF family protein [Geobacter sp. FeAm09]QEM69215.1 ComF family protein [Geobacter sp. FeAm09]
MNGFFSAFLDVLFPPLCHLCRAFVPDAGPLHICPACRERLSGVPHPLCPVCGIPFPGAGDDHVCGACRHSPPDFGAARAALLYEGECRELIHAYKYRYKTHLRRPLALLAAAPLREFVAACAPELMVPVPLHVRRLRERGFNQAVLLGEVWAREWGIPLERAAMRRIRWTEPQITLTAAERRANVQGAFDVRDAGLVRGRRVLLVDDVYTTGSTVRECARVLRAAGADGVRWSRSPGLWKVELHLVESCRKPAPACVE